MFMLTGNGDMDASEKIAAFGLSTMEPLSVVDPYGLVVAKRLRAPEFVKNPVYRDVSRDPEDTVMHAHAKHVLLMRSGQHVPDDTLICRHIDGLSALARAAIATDIERKLIEASPSGDPDTDELLESLVHAFGLLRGGFTAGVPSLMENGSEAVRRTLPDHRSTLRGGIKEELFRTLVAAHHELPKDRRENVEWDANELDALLIAAHTGHARSLLKVNLATATREEMDDALGVAEPRKDRGLHFMAFDPRPV